MSIILFPFKVIATIFGVLGKGIGTILGAIFAAWLTRWLLCAYAWNGGSYHITEPVLFWSMFGAFVLTLIAGHSSK